MVTVMNPSMSTSKSSYVSTFSMINRTVRARSTIDSIRSVRTSVIGSRRPVGAIGTRVAVSPTSRANASRASR